MQLPSPKPFWGSMKHIFAASRNVAGSPKPINLDSTWFNKHAKVQEQTPEISCNQTSEHSCRVLFRSRHSKQPKGFLSFPRETKAIQQFMLLYLRSGLWDMRVRELESSAKL